MSQSTARTPRLVLQAETARDLMTPNPLSIRDSASVHEAISVLTDKGLSAAPVIDQAGQPIGVLSQTDILAHDREKIVAPAAPPVAGSSSSDASQGEPSAGTIDLTPVRDLMTPAIFSVPPEMSADKVVEQMLSLNVRQLFVVDKGGVLVGVIHAIDVLRHLHPENG